MNQTTIDVESISGNRGVSFTDIPDMEGEAPSLEQENAMLRQALADAVQRQAEIQLERDNTVAMYEHKLSNMVSADSEADAPKFMKAIMEARELLNNCNDYGAYQTLDHIKTEYGEKYGFKEIDPLSPEALQLVGLY